MAIEKFCIHCGRHRGDLFKPTMVWNSLPNSAYKCWNGGDEYGYHEFGDWISDGKKSDSRLAVPVELPRQDYLA